MRRDEALDAIKEVQDYFEDEKERLKDGVYLRMCNALQKAYTHVAQEDGDEEEEEVQAEGNDDDEEGESEGEDEARGSDESDAEWESFPTCMQ